MDNLFPQSITKPLVHDPFGMITFGRSWEAGSEYRYGFNGMEGDDEIVGNDNALDFGARVYDARLGRWFSVDDKFVKYNFETPYSFVGNSPIFNLEIDGNQYVIYIYIHKPDLQLSKLEYEYLKRAVYDAYSKVMHENQLNLAFQFSFVDAPIPYENLDNTDIMFAFANDDFLNEYYSSSAIRYEDGDGQFNGGGSLGRTPEMPSQGAASIHPIWFMKMDGNPAYPTTQRSLTLQNNALDRLAYASIHEIIHRMTKITGEKFALMDINGHDLEPERGLMDANCYNNVFGLETDTNGDAAYWDNIQNIPNYMLKMSTERNAALKRNFSYIYGDGKSRESKSNAASKSGVQEDTSINRNAAKPVTK